MDMEKLYQAFIKTEKVAEKITSATTPGERWLLFFAAYHTRPIYGYILEIGTAWGKSALTMAATFQQKDLSSHHAVICIDIWEPYEDLAGPAHVGIGALITAGHNMGLTDRLIPIKHESRHVADMLRGCPVRMLFVDGSHKYEDANRDIIEFGSLVAEHGIIFCHDYATFPETRKAIDDAFVAMDKGRVGEKVAFGNIIYRTVNEWLVDEMKKALAFWKEKNNE